MWLVNLNYKKNYIISGSKSQTVPKIFLNNKISVQNDIFRLILKFFKNSDIVKLKKYAEL